MTAIGGPPAHDGPPYALVEVVWEDAAALTSEWTELAEVTETAQAAFTEPLVTAGYLVASADGYLVVCSALNPRLGHASGCDMIPRSAVRDARVLRAAAAPSPLQGAHL